jgi:hypothetical protein
MLVAANTLYMGSAVGGEEILARELAIIWSFREWNGPRCPLADGRIDRLSARMEIVVADKKKVLLSSSHLAA